jgi:hypothetical protein
MVTSTYEERLCSMAFFAGFENGKPVVATKGFVLEESGVLREDHALESNSTNSFLLYGDQGAAVRLLDDPTRPRDPLALVRQLIQVQIDENPQDFGPRLNPGSNGSLLSVA